MSPVVLLEGDPVLPGGQVPLEEILADVVPVDLPHVVGSHVEKVEHQLLFILLDQPLVILAQVGQIDAIVVVGAELAYFPENKGCDS